MKALDVANFFIKVGSMSGEDEMTDARINKLMYYAQGLSLARRGIPLFDEKIEAWDFGPVVDSVYQEYKKYGNKAIKKTKEGFSLDDIDREDFQIMMDVYLHFIDVDTPKIIGLTHRKGTPWEKVYEGEKNNEITQESMKKYFSKKERINSIDDIIDKIPTIGVYDDSGYRPL